MQSHPERSEGSRAIDRGAAVDLALLFAAKVAVGAGVLALGFSHVSDDDYSRVVIAQRFADHPALDPSGTSWLPFPFWLMGTVMLLVGRSLARAQAIAFVTGVVSVAAPYAAMRAAGCARVAAVAGTAIAMAAPWGAWLGVATVPEAMTACFVAGGVMLATARRGRVAGAVMLLAAALSRYEAWAACAVFAAGCWLAPRTAPLPPAPSPRSRGEGEEEAAPRALVFSLPPEVGGKGRGRGADKGGVTVPIVLSLVGPLLWLAWNAFAHGSPLHFVARVAKYRQSIGAAGAPLSEKLTAFPRALFTSSAPLLALVVLAAGALVLDAPSRRRWSWPLAAAAATLAFLVYGDVRDGAPTHHPERALLGVTTILACFAADGLWVLARRIAAGDPARNKTLALVTALAAVAWLASLPKLWADHPAASADESRDAQIARGLELARDAPPHVIVTPCAYEHFALMAAFAEPEKVDVEPPTRASVTATCPQVELR